MSELTQRPSPQQGPDQGRGEDTLHAGAAWKEHWERLGQPWRTEPEINEARQAELIQRLRILPDVRQGVYPFGGMRLSRADLEWLLAYHHAQRAAGDGKEHPIDAHGLDLRGADLSQADLQNLPLAGLLGEITVEDWLKYPDLSKEQQMMAAVHLERANLKGANLQGALLSGALLQKANLRQACLEHAHLVGAYLEEANLSGAHLQQANLAGAHLQAANLWKAHLEGANLRGADLDGTYLGNVSLCDTAGIGPILVDIRWGNVNLALIHWSQIRMLGDEHILRQRSRGRRLPRKALLHRHEEAVRANRQLALALADQGLAEDASRFAYRAQCLQRTVLRLQRRFGQYLFSWLLDLLAGYGYRPSRSLAVYLLVIALFTVAYSLLGQRITPHLSPLAALVLSLSAFHGRGFIPGGIPLDSPLPLLASCEAVIGLLVEIAFITTFTQRFLNRLGN